MRQLLILAILLGALSVAKAQHPVYGQWVQINDEYFNVFDFGLNDTLSTTGRNLFDYYGTVAQFEAQGDVIRLYHAEHDSDSLIIVSQRDAELILFYPTDNIFWKLRRMPTDAPPSEINENLVSNDLIIRYSDGRLADTLYNFGDEHLLWRSEDPDRHQVHRFTVDSISLTAGSINMPSPSVGFSSFNKILITGIHVDRLEGQIYDAENDSLTHCTIELHDLSENYKLPQDATTLIGRWVMLKDCIEFLETAEQSHRSIYIGHPSMKFDEQRVEIISNTLDSFNYQYEQISFGGKQYLVLIGDKDDFHNVDRFSDSEVSPVRASISGIVSTYEVISYKQRLVILRPNSGPYALYLLGGKIHLVKP